MSSSLSEKDWLDILDDIRDQKAVLMIGPGIMHVNGSSLDQLLRDSILQNHEDDIAYYHERDGFFLFNSPLAKIRVARQVKRFYRKTIPDETFLLHLIQIRFPLIVSINPDKYISEAFDRYGINHNFKYFQHSPHGNETEEIEKPKMDSPLVYNLFGMEDRDESLVLDYHDVSKMLKSIIGTPGLPEKILSYCQQATTYIFLGFQFDKWYLQLLLSLLSDKERCEKLISVNKRLNDHDTHQFIMHQFKVTFIDEQFDFLGELYKRCLGTDLFRKLENPLSSKAVIIRQSLAKNEIEYALEIFYNESQGKEFENTIIHLMYRYQYLKDKGNPLDKSYEIERAQIVGALIELSNNI